jgi:hypothetical protein
MLRSGKNLSFFSFVVLVQGCQFRNVRRRPEAFLCGVKTAVCTPPEKTMAVSHVQLAMSQ